LIALGIIICAQVANGQAGEVGIYTDQAGTTCWINPMPVGPYSLSLYVVHTLGGPTTGVGFNIVPGGGFSGAPAVTTLTPPFVAAGTPWGATGVGVGYGSCIATPIMVYSFLFDTGPSPACAFLSVEDAPITTGFVGVEVNDCNQPYANSLLARDMRFYVNGDEGTCPVCIVPATIKRTWGKVKSLYN
jgi:hypothetical protein